MPAVEAGEEVMTVARDPLEISKLDASQLAEQGREVWGRIKQDLPEEHVEAFNPFVDTMTDRLKYAATGSPLGAVR